MLLSPAIGDEGSVPWVVRNTFIDIDIVEDNLDSAAKAEGAFFTTPKAWRPYSSLQAGPYLPAATGTSKKEKQSSSEEEGELPEDGEILSNEAEENELPEDGEVFSNDLEEGELFEDSEETEQEQLPPETTEPNLPPPRPGGGRRRRAAAAYPPPPPGEPVPSKGSARHYSGTCRPCAWLHRPDGSGCRNAEACLYCHLCPDGELKRRKKAKMQRRMDEVRQLRLRMRMLDGEAATSSIMVAGSTLGGGQTAPAMVDGRAVVGAGGAMRVVVSEALATEPRYIEVRPERPAPGALGHNLGRCRPCAWYHKDSSSCRNGQSCRYCHLCPPGELKRRKREKWGDIQRPLLETLREDSATAAVAIEPVRIAAPGQ